MNRLFSPLQQFLITWLLILVTGWVTLNERYLGELLSILVTAGLIAFLLNYVVAGLRPLAPGVAAVLVYLMAEAVVLIALTLVPPVFNQARLCDQFTVPAGRAQKQ